MSNRQRSRSRRPGQLRRMTLEVKNHRALARQDRFHRRFLSEDYSLPDGARVTSGKSQVAAQRRHVSKIGDAWTAAIMRRGKEKNLPLAGTRRSESGPSGLRWRPGAMRKGVAVATDEGRYGYVSDKPWPRGDI
jgi:hypothetical protein